jgi:hypothetical protein
MRFQVPLLWPSPNCWVSKAHWNYGFYEILIILCKKYQDWFCKLGLAFCSTQLSTRVPSLTSKKWCHVGIHVILGTWDLVWSGKFQLTCSHWLSLCRLTSSELGFRTWDMCDLALKVTLRTNQEPWLWKSKCPWKSFKGRTVGTRALVLQWTGPRF